MNNGGFWGACGSTYMQIFFFSIKWTWPVVGWIQNAEPGIPRYRTLGREGCVSSHKWLFDCWGSAPLVPVGFKLSCIDFLRLSLFVLLTSPSSARSYSGIPHCTELSLLSSLLQPVTAPQSATFVQTLLNLRWTWDTVSWWQGSSLRLLWSRHRSNRKEREGLLMAKDRECEGHKEWMETNVQKSTVVTGHHYMSNQWRLLC